MRIGRIGVVECACQTKRRVFVCLGVDAVVARARHRRVARGERALVQGLGVLGCIIFSLFFSGFGVWGSEFGV